MKLFLTLLLLLFGLPALIGIKAAIAALFLASALALCLWINRKTRGKCKTATKQKDHLVLNDWGEFVTPDELHDIAEIPHDPRRSIET